MTTIDEAELEDDRRAEADKDILATLRHSAICWHMPAGKIGDKEIPARDMFERDLALAALLANEAVFLNSFWMEDSWPDEAKKMPSLWVNCNDVFAWGCADGEPLPFDEIENVYRAWIKDRSWGTAVWCMMRRNQMPQKPVEDRIRKAGIWDLDALKLGANTMDAEVSAMFRQLASQA